MQKKKNYNSGKKVSSTVVPKKKVDKNTVYAFILLAFFIFWTIGSIFAFIDFGKNKQSNVVSASADVVQDFNQQGSVNLVDFYSLGYVTYGDNIYNFSAYDDIFKHYIDVSIGNPSQYSSMSAFMPLEYIYSGDLVPNQEYLLAFFVDIDLPNNMPVFTLYESDENGDYYDHYNINMSDLITGLYTISFTPVQGHYYDINLSLFYNPTLNRFPLYNVQLKTLSYNGYAYTYEELVSIYENEINAAYQEGATSNRAYDIGYNEGYIDGVNESASLFNGFFYKPWQVWVSDYDRYGEYNEGFTITDFTNMDYYGSSSVVSFPKSIGNAFNSVDKDIADYFYNYIEFRVNNLSYSIDYFSMYIDITFNTGDIITSSNLYNTFKYYIYDEDNQGHQAQFEQVTDTKWLLSFPTFPQGDMITAFSFNCNLLNISYWVFNNEYYFLTEDNGSAYNVGFNAGYATGYNSALSNYQRELDDAYAKGMKYGETVGYNQGYTAGMNNANEYSFTGLLSAVIDVPINAFRSFFNFDLLGINLADFFFALLTICIILGIIKIIV